MLPIVEEHNSCCYQSLSCKAISMRILKVNLILTWQSNHFFDWNRTTKSIPAVERGFTRELSVERKVSIELVT